MSQISVISKLTGVETTTEGNQVSLGQSSIVKLHVGRADISHYARNGNDLVVSLNSGETITLKNFYVGDAQGASMLVLEESNGALWWIEDPTAVEHYEAISSIDALMAASGSDASGGAAIWPWVLGGAAVAGALPWRRVAEEEVVVVEVVAGIIIIPATWGIPRTLSIQTRRHPTHRPISPSPRTVLP